MAEPPTNFVLEMQRSGLNDMEIIMRLREQGYTDKEINDAVNQARVKQTIRPEEFQTGAMAEIPETPMPPPPELSEEFIPAPSSSTAPATPAYPTPEQGYEYGYPETQESYEGYAEPGTAYTTEAFEEIAESIIEERWRTFMEKIGDIQGWKERVNREIVRMEKRMEKMDDSLRSVHAAMIEKVGEYGKSIKGLGTDVKAMEKAFSQMLQPMMKNVKEIKSAAEKIKRKKK